MIAIKIKCHLSFLTHSYTLVTACLPFPHKLLPLLLPTTLGGMYLNLPVCTVRKQAQGCPQVTQAASGLPGCGQPSPQPAPVPQPPPPVTFPSSPFLQNPLQAAKRGRREEESPPGLQLWLECQGGGLRGKLTGE